MTDREKVIDGLNETISYLRIKTGGVVDRCIQHQYDALELLKEQEPRVLTHKEVIELDEGKSVWFEESDDSGNTFIGQMVCHGKGLFSNRYMCVDAKRLYWFGRRFWTAKPTDEQRKAVKWDG